MPVVPVLMVLYTNDATEVRYSDGSCLRMAPCGSTFVHYQNPGETIHPAHGMKMISHRCQFVTSDYRQKVLEALDFRNRFAERPYVCPDLLLQDQLVPLYADISDVAWPQTLEKASYEYLPDGSVRLISEDEHSSMVFSTHKQDFTICYLSKVSQDKPKVKARHKFKAKSMTSATKRTENGLIRDGFQPEVKEKQKISPGNGFFSRNQCSDRCLLNSDSVVTNISSEIRNTSEKVNMGSDNTALTSPHNQQEQTDSPTPKLNDDKKNYQDTSSNVGHGRLMRNIDSVEGYSGSPLSDDLQRRLTGDLSISPISLISGLGSEKSSPCTEEEYRLYSTPTYAQTDPRGAGSQKFIHEKGATFKQYKREHQDDGSFLDYPSGKDKSEDVDSAVDETLTSQNVSITQDRRRTKVQTEFSQNGNSSDIQNPPQIVFRSRQLITDENNPKTDFNEDKFIKGKLSNEPSPSIQSERRTDRSWEESSPRNQSGVREVGSWEEYSPGSQLVDRKAVSMELPEARIHYTWVTRHYSCEECPVVWSHPVNLARAVLDNRESLEQKALKLCSNPKKTLSNSRSELRNKCVLSTLPRPLPLSCEGQHLHSLGGQYLYDDEKDVEANLAIFKQGKLKVLLIEGVVFRFVRLATTKVVEIFPGDGSVITSQGLSGHFFKHVIPRGHDKVEERTYSLKSAPPTPPKAAYSVEKLIKRAHRLLLQAGQEDKMITNADVCCWKYVDRKLELLPTSLLEDCCIPNHGKFSAYSNGHVRILFDDRTSLEMTCDFSRRVKSCLEHTEGTSVGDAQMEADENHSILVTKQHLTAKQTGLCKLLLPNGQYQIVDVHQSGVYKKYTDAAMEWQAWVNSSPGQRKDFYERWDKQDNHNVMAAKELQKIKCFNYIVDNTMGKQTSSQSDSAVISQPSTTRVNVVQYSSVPQIGYLDKSDSITNKWLSDEDQGHYSQGHHGAFSQGHTPTASGDGHMITEWNSGNQGYSIPPRKFLPASGQNLYQRPRGPSRNITDNASMNSYDTLQGFNAVRQALLKTSKAIQDIDCILDKQS
ncbi:uncharacterized protein C5orf34 homolog [Ylistrum balloti]|uniref:uncharacterized protein C5orf34 homolog n=1 Tax=Ylistrum balloti TaxID=509963 RepID=UPI002905B513|nr:uncharacterized protein C5orf34 homolog [Ylistrum balloti]